MFPALPNSFLHLNNISDVANNKQEYMNSINKVSGKCISSAKLKFENVITNLTQLPTVNKQQQIINQSSDGVFAAEFLKRDLQSKEMSSVELLSHSHSRVKKLNIRISEDGFLEPTTKMCSSSNWLRNMKYSADVHSNNVIVEITSNGLIRIRILKEIKIGEEMTYWFAENIVAHMAIPFLIPRNIRGNNCYTCHICNVSYESPNPLKIHLALLCDQQSIDILWIRLHHNLQKFISSSSSSSSSFSCSFLRTSSNHVAERLASLETSSTPPPPLLPSSSHSQRFSAFKPVTTTSTSTTTAITSSLYLSQLYQTTSSSSQQSSVVTLADAAAQIETIVSNMGSSKQGHLCIYCGKIYSRKYGLKIHIRTHTGFKPLKCKFCYRPFGDPSNLNKHIRLHLQSNKNSVYKCHFCSKIMGRRRDLQRHIQSRHSEMISVDEVKKASSSDDD